MVKRRKTKSAARRPKPDRRPVPDRLGPVGPAESVAPVLPGRDPRSGGTRALVAVGLTYALAFGIWFLATRPETVAGTDQPRPPASYVLTTENTGSVGWWRVPVVVTPAAMPPPPALGPSVRPLPAIGTSVPTVTPAPGT
ncbi:MAG: hypothetical protein WKF80_04105 [Thermomicrobiales bacterium]